MSRIFTRFQSFASSRAAVLISTLLIWCLAAGIVNTSIPFPWQMPAVALIAIACLFLRGETTLVSRLSFGLKHPLQTLAVIAIVVIFSKVVLELFLFPLLLKSLGIKDADTSSFAFTQLPQLVRFIGMAWLSAALGEELVFRYFLIEQMQYLFGRSAAARAGICLLAAVAFAWPHHEQGPFGLIVTGTVGLVFAVAYLCGRKNLLALIVAHGVIDTWSLIELYKPNR